jgi:hypothetical protein
MIDARIDKALARLVSFTESESRGVNSCRISFC